MFFKKKREISVQDTVISIERVGDEDYLSLTDMLKSKDGEFVVKDWLRNRNTLEFLGVWEQVHNTDFNWEGFTPIAQNSGLNTFNISAKEWIEKTNAKGIIAKAGRYGGTYAHRDIAFEFGTWINPVFKLYLIKEYQRLKEIEGNQYNLEWNVKRILSKANYHIHTEAVKDHIIPNSKKIWCKELEYAEEADLLNLAVFGCIAKDWRIANPECHKAGLNIRDLASINELMVLSNVESMNAEMLCSKIDKKTRFEKLQDIAQRQLELLNAKDILKSIKRTSDEVYLLELQKKQ